jgi:hypothetical protein
MAIVHPGISTAQIPLKVQGSELLTFLKKYFGDSVFKRVADLAKLRLQIYRKNVNRLATS